MFENFDWLEAIRRSPVMIVILGCSVITLGFAIERLRYYWSRRGDVGPQLDQAAEKVKAGNWKEAAWACSVIKHPAGPVAASVLQSAHLGREAQEETMQIALSEQRLLLERNLGVLGTMGNTAPLIGLLGTVWGIMRAFHDMASTGSAGPSVGASGGAEALVTPAAGPPVAAPPGVPCNPILRP